MSNQRSLDQVPLSGRLLSANSYFCTYPVGTSTQVLTANRVYYQPLEITVDTIIRSIGINVTGAVALSNILLGIYSWPRGEFSEAELLVSTGQISTASTGFKEEAIELHLKQGLYLSALANSGAITVRATSTTVIGTRYFWLSAATATSEVYFGYESLVFGALPNTPGSLTLSTSGPLSVIFQT